MTNEEFAAIVTDATKRIEGNIRWGEHPQRAGAQEFRAPIDSDAGYPLFVVGRYNDAMGKLTYAIIHWNEGPIYVLHLGISHLNPGSSEGATRKLLECTHKHYWTEQHRGRLAYQPREITETWECPLEVWHRFCAEARIDHRGNLEPPATQGDFPL